MLKSKWATKTKNPAINISSKRLWCVLVMNETSIFSGSHRSVNRCLAWFMESIKQQFTYVTFIFPHQLYRVPSTPYDTVISVCIYIECKEKTFSCGVWKKNHVCDEIIYQRSTYWTIYIELRGKYALCVYMHDWTLGSHWLSTIFVYDNCSE